MKTAVIILCVAALAIFEVNGAVFRVADDGRYNPNAGQYHPDNSGQYRPDQSGSYSGSYEKYKHTADKFGNGDGAGGGNGGNGGHGFGSGGSGGNGNNNGGVAGGSVQLINSQRNQNVALIKFISSGIGKFGSGLGSQGVVVESAFGAPSGLKHGSAAGLYDNRNYGIIRKVENVEQDGYHYLYETENGILGEEQGKLANRGSEDEVMKANGFFEYTGPDNVVYKVTYTADENGFVPQGAHIPTPPPVPAAILRALEYQRSVGTL